MDSRQYVEQLAAKVADEWFTFPAIESVFCYYRNGDAVAATEQPDGYDLAMNERLSPAWDKRIVTRKVADALMRCPCLPLE